MTLFMCALLAGIAIIDLRNYRVPHYLVIPGVILALLAGGSFIGCLIGLGTGFAIRWALAKGYLDFGDGDIQLMVLLGALLGVLVAPLGALIAFSALMHYKYLGRAPVAVYAALWVIPLLLWLEG